ncbi:MAG TPA: PAS domain S-box protein, partial [Balneolaceae bacterium]|nr:PAS domain S-box protein [Balneolaceae bacterium]
MENRNNLLNTDFKKHFLGIVITLAVLAGGLLLYNIFSETLDDGMRDFIAEQGIWSKSQKTAVINLMYYVQTGNEDKFSLYQEEMRKLHMDDQAIDSLKNDSPATADSLFSPLLGRLDANDFQDLKTFITGYSSPVLSSILPNAHLFDQAFATREKAENQLLRLQELAQAIKTEYQDSPPPYPKREQYLKELYSIDSQLTMLAHHFIYDLSDLSRSLNHFTLINLIAAGLILLLAGGLSSIRYMKNLKEWRSKLLRKNKDLRSSKKTYRDLLHSMQDGIIILNEKGTFVELNTAAAKMFGYAKSEMIDLKPEDIIAPESIEQSRKSSFLKEAFSGERKIFERWARRKDGSTFPMEVTLSKGKFFDEDVVISIVRDITDRQEYIKELQQANQQNRILLQEIHHRVKNNMALVAGLLQLQSFDITDPEMQAILLQSERRIHTIADVHEHLYQSKNLVSIDFKSYLNSFIENVNHHASQGNNIDITTNTPSFLLNINQALPTALLLNEILIQLVEKGDKEIKIDVETEQDLIEIDIKGKSHNGKDNYQT